MACPAFAPGMRTPPFMRLVMTRGVGPLLGALPPSARVGRSMMRQIGHGASLDAGTLSQDLLDWYLALQRYTDTSANEGRMIASLGGPLGFDRRLTIPDEVLGRVTSPTVFLWGEDDTFGGAEVAQRIVAAMPRASLQMMPDAGHLPWIDDPDHAAKAVMDHLAG